MKMLSLVAAITMLGAGTAGAAAADDFTFDATVRSVPEQLIISFHADKQRMAACSPEQRDAIIERGKFHFDAVGAALAARSVGRADPAGTVLKVEIDAACYEDGYMGIAGLARGAEKIQFAYEETKLGGEWGPSKDKPVQ